MLLLGLMLAAAKAWAVGLYFGQWGDGPQRGMAATRQLLVFFGAPGLPGNLLVAQGAFYLRRIAKHHAAWRALEAGFDKAGGTYQRFSANQGVVHDDGIHADKGISADTAAMQNGPMANMPVFLNDAVFIGKAVHDTGVLQVAASFHHHPAKVSAQHRARADITVSADDDIANQYRCGMHIGAFVYDGDKVFDGKNIHGCF